MERGRARLTALATLVLVAVLGAPARAATTPWCEAVGFSPRFATDRTMFCAVRLSGSATGFALYRSGDRGRTWQLRSTTHAPRTEYTPSVTPMAVYVDDGYPTVRRLFVLVTAGMWQSDDDGKTVVQIVRRDPMELPTAVTPYREHAPGQRSVLSRPAFAIALRNVVLNSGAVVDPLLVSSGIVREESPVSPSYRTVLGAPTNTSGFILPPDFADTREAVAIGHDLVRHHDSDSIHGETIVVANLQAFSCTGELVCQVPIHDFGPKADPIDRGSLPGGVEWMQVDELRNPLFPRPADWWRVWHSPDYGRTWQRWTSVERLLWTKDVITAGTVPQISIMASPDAPNRYFLRSSMPPHIAPKLKTTPMEQLFRSDDRGKTWRRVAYARNPEQRGDRGTLPYNTGGWPRGGVFTPWTSAQPGGRLYTIAATMTAGPVGNELPTYSFKGLYCSADLGRTWRRGGGC